MGNTLSVKLIVYEGAPWVDIIKGRYVAVNGPNSSIEQRDRVSEGLQRKDIVVSCIESDPQRDIMSQMWCRSFLSEDESKKG